MDNDRLDEALVKYVGYLHLHINIHMHMHIHIHSDVP